MTRGHEVRCPRETWSRAWCSLNFAARPCLEGSRAVPLTSGFGPVAGLLTLAFASMIFLAKMLAEDIENVRFGPVEAVRATGAGFGQTVIYSIVPQVLSRTVGMLIYRLDANVRHSTVIGIVGAGGIGQSLSASFSRYDFDFSAAILLSIIALVAIGEWFSDWVRRKLR